MSRKPADVKIHCDIAALLEEMEERFSEAIVYNNSLSKKYINSDSGIICLKERMLSRIEKMIIQQKNQHEIKNWIFLHIIYKE